MQNTWTTGTVAGLRFTGTDDDQTRSFALFQSPGKTILTSHAKSILTDQMWPLLIWEKQNVIYIRWLRLQESLLGSCRSADLQEPTSTPVDRIIRPRHFYPLTDLQESSTVPVNIGLRPLLVVARKNFGFFFPRRRTKRHLVVHQKSWNPGDDKGYRIYT